MGLTDIKQLLPKDVYDAAVNSASPSAANPFATESYVDTEGYKVKVDAGDASGQYLIDKLLANEDIFYLDNIDGGGIKTIFSFLQNRNKPFESAVDPTVNDDDTVVNKFRIGQIWVNTVTDASFIAKDLSTGAAVWDEIVSKSQATITTTDDSVTTIATLAIPDDTRVTLKVHFVARRTDSSTDNGGSWERWGSYLRDGGSVVREGTIYTPFTRETPVGLNVDLTESGNNILIEVKGITGATYEWKAIYEILSI